MFHLVVTNAFDGHQRGDVISDAEIVTEIMAGEHKGDVVRVEAPHPHISAIELAEAEWAALTQP